MTDIDLSKPLEYWAPSGKWFDCRVLYVMKCPTTNYTKYQISNSFGSVSEVPKDKIRNKPEKPAEQWWELPPDRLRFNGGVVLAAKLGHRIDVKVWYVDQDGIPCVDWDNTIDPQHITILPPRKSLGWVTVHRGVDGDFYCGITMYQTREEAIRIGSHNPADVDEPVVACVEIFEGDGL